MTETFYPIPAVVAVVCALGLLVGLSSLGMDQVKAAQTAVVVPTVMFLILAGVLHHD